MARSTQELNFARHRGVAAKTVERLSSLLFPEIREAWVAGSGEPNQGQANWYCDTGAEYDTERKAMVKLALCNFAHELVPWLGQPTR